MLWFWVCLRSGEGHIVRYCTFTEYFLHIFKINEVEVKDRLEHRPRISSEDMYCLSTDQACKFGHRKIKYV